MKGGPTKKNTTTAAGQPVNGCSNMTVQISNKLTFVVQNYVVLNWSHCIARLPRMPGIRMYPALHVSVKRIKFDNVEMFKLVVLPTAFRTHVDKPVIISYIIALVPKLIQPIRFKKDWCFIGLVCWKCSEEWNELTVRMLGWRWSLQIIMITRAMLPWLLKRFNHSRLIMKSHHHTL